MTEIKPITPEEVLKHRKMYFPDEVIKAFNDLITRNWNGKQSIIFQEDVINKIIENFSTSGREIEKEDIFKNKWLDIEDIYRGAGWSVSYDRPAIGEDYKPHFVFVKP